MGKVIALAVLLLIPVAGMAEMVGGPARYHVDATGRYVGTFRDVVDSETGDVVIPVIIPSGLREVATRPSAPGKLWDGEAWVVDDAYQEPTRNITANELLGFLVRQDVITERDAEQFLQGEN